MAIQSDETLVTKGDLKTLYTDKILPYLGGNMMMQTGVSDYYSEDEKVVGVWIDGKPIYKRTFTVEVPSGTSKTDFTQVNLSTTSHPEVIVDSNITIDYFNNNSSTPHWKDNTPQEDEAFIFINPNLIGLNYRVQSQLHINIYATAYYTKTTDIASSALTTPGCYDLNRPDLWPTDKEIFFGNGLYGYRKIGTNITVPKQSRTDIVLVTTGNANTKIYNSGGTLENANWKYAIPSSHTAGNGDQFVWFNKNNGSWTNNSIMFYISNNSATAALSYTNYDIWVTYTK